MYNKASSTKWVIKEPLSNKINYFYIMDDKAREFAVYYSSFKSMNQKPIAKFMQLTGSTILLLSIPAAFLFHEFSVLYIAITLEILLTALGLFLTQNNWQSFLIKPLKLWKAKGYFLLDFLSGNE
jgi:hypothetical protein